MSLLCFFYRLSVPLLAVLLLSSMHVMTADLQWIDITNMSAWYRPVDICQLTQEQGDIRLYHTNNCHAESRILACSATQGGIGLGGPKRLCYPPFKRRTHFWKVLNEYATEPKKRYFLLNDLVDSRKFFLIQV